MKSEKTQLLEIRRLILIFIAGLIVSGVTAFPLLWELQLAKRFLDKMSIDNQFTSWITTVFFGVDQTYSKFPFIAYGTDWLAFAHLVIAIAFIGPLRDPVRNIWVIDFGLISCVAIFPLALIAGAIRQIPFFWQVIDCSFGVFGFILLWSIRSKIQVMEKMKMERDRSGFAS